MARRVVQNGLYLKPNGVYERVEVIDGKRRSFSSKNPAEVWMRISEAKKFSGVKIEKTNPGPSFHEVADRYRTDICAMSTGTRKSYLPALERCDLYFGEQPISEIKPYQIGEFLRSISHLARTTVSNQKTVLNQIFQVWVEDPVWQGKQNTAKMVPIPKRLAKSKRLPPTDEQIDIVKRHALDPDALPPLLFLCTGGRRGEILALQVKDVDFDKKVIDISKSVEHVGNRPVIRNHTKTAAGIRQIPLLPLLETALLSYRDEDPDIFVLGRKKTPMTASAYRRAWESFWKKHKVGEEIERVKHVARRNRIDTIHYTEFKTDICAHQFRHEYVCMLCEAGVPEAVAIMLVGHADSRMIHEVYISLKPSMVSDARAKLSNLF